MTLITKRSLKIWHQAYVFVASLAFVIVLLGDSLQAQALDELYEKPPSEKNWGEIAADLVGYDGFTKSYALVVGISEYTGGYDRLPTEQDPIRIRDFLIDEAGFDYVHVLTDEKATYSRIRQLMVNVFPGLVDGDDRFFFYWSGHGTQRDNRRGGQDGFLPLAASARDDFASMVSMGDIGRWDNAINGRHVLFFLDACLSGLAGTASMTENRQVELNDMVEPAHHLMTAGTSDEETIAGDRWGGSVFTHAFLRAVRGAADTDSQDFPKDGVVSLFELIKHVRDYVPQEARNAGWDKSITPQLRDLGGSDGEFFFVTSEDRLARLERRGETPSGEILGGEAVGKGDNTPQLSPGRIRQVQEMLIELGFQPGEPDGILGARMRAAISTFQRSLGEPATGDLTEAEERQLALAYADHSARKPAAGPDGQQDKTFRDCPDCPEMVIIPAGSFMMGSPEDEEGRAADEGPQHRVTIGAPFALGRYEVTRGQFSRFVSETDYEAEGCRYWDGDSWENDTNRNWHNPGYEQTDAHPVTCVSWEDAKVYLDWLRKETRDDSYRLPSEAEWEYAARAGTTTAYFWGDEADNGCAFANGVDQTAMKDESDWSLMACDDGYFGTAPVGSYSANPFGLHDMSGNLREWVEDRWHENHHGAPSDGSSRVKGNNSARVFRGGSWFSEPRFLRSADRNSSEPDGRYGIIGFRVARTLTP